MTPTPSKTVSPLLSSLPGGSALPLRGFAARSIRARLTRNFTLLIALLLTLADVFLLTLGRTIESRNAEFALRNAERHVTVALAGAEDEAEEARRRSVDAAAAPFIVPEAVIGDVRKPLTEEQIALVIYDPASGRLWRAGNALHGGPVWPRPPAAGGPGDDGWRVRYIPAPVSDSLQIMVAFPWWREAREQRDRLVMLSALTLLAVAATAAGTWALVGRTLSPIDRLARQAEGVSSAPPPSSLSPDPRGGIALGRLRLTAPSADAEVVRLVETLNLLIGRVEESADARGRFYAAASHELRTPLHALAGQVELTVGRPRTREEYLAALLEVGAQAERLNRLVESLLLLNRLETRGYHDPAIASAVTEAGDIRCLCHRLLDEAETIIRDRRLTVRLDLPDENPGTEAHGAFDDAPPVAGPIAHVEILMRNLLENALRYAPPGSAVRLALRRPTNGGGGGGLCFKTENPAPDLGTEQARHLGEAFFRPDASRTASTGGNGLGLALCRALCDANGWQLTLAKDDQTGLFRAAVCFAEACP